MEIAAIVRPGDTLIIGFSSDLTDETIEQLGEDFRELTDKGIAIAVIENVTSMVVARFEPEKKSPPRVTLEGYEVPGER